MTISSLTVGFLAGFPAAAIEVYAPDLLRTPVSALGVILRGTPIVVLIVLLFFTFPGWGLGSFILIDLNVRAFIVATTALGLRSAAYQAQVFLGSIQSIDEGQMEAARSIGLSKVGAIRRSVSGFQNEFTIVLKDTSIAFAIGLAELLTRAEQLYLQPGRDTAVVEVIITISVIHFILTFATNRALDRLEDKYAIPEGSA